jgi:hypothetical protein
VGDHTKKDEIKFLNLCVKGLDVRHTQLQVPGAYVLMPGAKEPDNVAFCGMDSVAYAIRDATSHMRLSSFAGFMPSSLLGVRCMSHSVGRYSNTWPGEAMPPCIEQRQPTSKRLHDDYLEHVGNLRLQATTHFACQQRRRDGGTESPTQRLHEPGNRRCTHRYR